MLAPRLIPCSGCGHSSRKIAAHHFYIHSFLSEYTCEQSPFRYNCIHMCVQRRFAGWSFKIEYKKYFREAMCSHSPVPGVVCVCEVYSAGGALLATTLEAPYVLGLLLLGAFFGVQFHMLPPYRFAAGPSGADCGSSSEGAFVRWPMEDCSMPPSKSISTKASE